MRCKPHARFGRRPGETEQTATLSPRPGPTSPGHPGRRRSPPPSPTGHPRPARPQGRPAVQDPRPATPRPRTPDRQADPQAQHLPHHRRPRLGGHPGLARLPATPLDVPSRHPSRGGPSPSRSSPRSPAARSQKSPALVGRCGCGASMSWPGSRRTGSPRWHRSRQPAHREDPTPRPWLPHLRALPATNPARRLGTQALPTSTHPRLIPKSPFRCVRQSAPPPARFGHRAPKAQRRH